MSGLLVPGVFGARVNRGLEGGRFTPKCEAVGDKVNNVVFSNETRPVLTIESQDPVQRLIASLLTPRQETRLS